MSSRERKRPSLSELRAWCESLGKTPHELAAELGIEPIEALHRQLAIAREVAPHVLQVIPQRSELQLDQGVL